MQPLAREQHAGFRQFLIENLPISVSICLLGIIPASDSLLALTKIIKRILLPPFYIRPELFRGINPDSIYLTNDRSPNGHPAASKLKL